MTIRQAIALGAETLAAVPDPKLDTVELLCTVLGDEPLVLQLKAGESLTPMQEERFRSLLLLRARREPLHYLLGTRCFYGLDFAVDARALIPRQETEMLCELALRRMMEFRTPRVLDIGTGSGAIAVTLKKNRADALVTATDLSAEALSLARENAKRLGASIRFLRGDLLAPVAGETFDVIVSNPPYVESAACDTLQPEVRREPRLALDGGADGLDCYRRLAAETPAILREGGYLLLEVGDGQASAVIGLLRETDAFADARYHLDLYRKRRYVSARRAAQPT